MPTYQAPVKDMLFILNRVIDISQYSDIAGYDKLAPDILSAILEEAGRFCNEVLAPLNMVGDREGCTLHSEGQVTTPAGFKEAYQQYVEAGWPLLAMPEEFGGQGMPAALALVIEEFLQGSNQAFAMYPGLTQSAITAIHATGSPELQATYLPAMTSGRWSGTMNLTEPHCGTDLGLLRTKAVPQADGSYAISGTKIFISSGEHDLTENIIHLVLAKTPDAPDSVKGISLFLVPKFLPDSAGNVGERNSLSCTALEHKMGIRGNATCALTYDEAIGYMVGEENKGLAAMFIMMNSARLGVAFQGVAQAYVSYQNALAYAQERRQGRALTGPEDPNERADPLFAQPDVRRMLMNGKALTEGLRALCLWCATQVDVSHSAASEEARLKADDMVGLLTPVLKGFGTDMGYQVATDAQQIFGGHGYIEETGMSQFVRDARITMIYEGANGVQAMDLVGRKLARHGGRAIQAFFADIDAQCTAAESTFPDLAAALRAGLEDLQAATMWLMQNAMANPNNAGAAAYSYMYIVGYVAVGSMWLKMAQAAQTMLADANEDKDFAEAKITTAQYYAQRFLPETAILRRKIESGSETMMKLTPKQFLAA